MKTLVGFAVLFLFGAATASAQRVVANNGEVIPGEVVAVVGSRAKIKASDGKLKVLDVRTIDREELADDSELHHAALLVAGAMPAATKAALARLRDGEELLPPELASMTDSCTADTVAALVELTTHKKAAVRALAVQVLVASATKEGLRAAIDAVLADRSGAAWRDFVMGANNGACVQAVIDCDGVADVAKGLTASDKAVRFGCAWIAAKAGLAEGAPVLARFLADSDHHVRESAAVALAECGEASGAKLLIAMSKRERSPAMEANRNADAETQDLVRRLTRAERIRCCQLLGKLRCKDAVATLTALTKHADRDLAAAATAALAAIARTDAGSGH